MQTTWELWKESHSGHSVVTRTVVLLRRLESRKAGGPWRSSPPTGLFPSPWEGAPRARPPRQGAGATAKGNSALLGVG